MIAYPDTINWAVVPNRSGSSAIALEASSQRTIERHTHPERSLQHTGWSVDYYKRPMGENWDGTPLSRSELHKLRAGLRRNRCKR